MLKYAEASSATVRAHYQGDDVIVELEDDGNGGADERKGSGLQGLRDRVAALDGTLMVIAEPGEGTLIRARIPWRGAEKLVSDAHGELGHLATASRTSLHVAAPWRRPARAGEYAAMLLLTGNTQETAEVWSARAVVRAEPRDVLAALTDPELIAAWAPVGFELEDPDAPPLRAGSHERVCGSLAGVKAFFDVDVSCAELGRLELVADRPAGDGRRLPLPRAGRARRRRRERRPAPPQRADRQDPPRRRRRAAERRRARSRAAAARRLALRPVPSPSSSRPSAAQTARSRRGTGARPAPGSAGRVRRPRSSGAAPGWTAFR